MLLFVVCLRLADQDESRISLLKNLNEILFNTQLFGQRVNTWETIAQMREKILDFQIEIKNSLQNLIPK